MVIITFYLICQEFFSYCIQKFKIEEDTVQPGHFEFPIFYEKYIVIPKETIS
jgi:hypothetical protein